MNPKNKKLTDEQVRNIRKDYAAGRGSQLEIAMRYNTSQQKVWAIVKKKAYKNVA